jgi:hypothetical protein
MLDGRRVTATLRPLVEKPLLINAARRDVVDGGRGPARKEQAQLPIDLGYLGQLVSRTRLEFRFCRRHVRRSQSQAAIT